MTRKPALIRRPPPVVAFAGVTLGALALLSAGAVVGGLLVWLALACVTVLIWGGDLIFPEPAPDATDQPFDSADRLSATLGLLHFPALALAVLAISGGSGLTWPETFAAFLGFGLFFGQVSNSNAHELIHRADKRLFRLGMWVYVSLLFGHHASAHRLVHHRFVATPDDPNTAELGEPFWDFARRAWAGSFVAGYEMERNLRATLPPAKGTGARLRRMNPYVIYLGGAAGFVIGATALFGAAGLLVYLALCAHAQVQLLLADYVQHYGLERRAIGVETHEPVGPAHSWDAPQPLSSLWMLNAPRHSDHHAHPGRAYPGLQLGDTETAGRPILPRSLPVMATLALIPPLWRRVMDRRVVALRQQAHAAVAGRAR